MAALPHVPTLIDSLPMEVPCSGLMAVRAVPGGSAESPALAIDMSNINRVARGVAFFGTATIPEAATAPRCAGPKGRRGGAKGRREQLNCCRG